MKLSYLFSDGMVLQREKKNYIWGETSPEIIVAGILDGKKFNTKADTHGMFVAELPDLPVGGPYCMEINGDEKRVIRNIMSGDVFLLGGQSNMELRIYLTVSSLKSSILILIHFISVESPCERKDIQKIVVSFVTSTFISPVYRGKSSTEIRIVSLSTLTGTFPSA